MKKIQIAKMFLVQYEEVNVIRLLDEETHLHQL